MRNGWITAAAAADAGRVLTFGTGGPAYPPWRAWARTKHFLRRVTVA